MAWCRKRSRIARAVGTSLGNALLVDYNERPVERAFVVD
jgi:hypothetical protein